MFRFREPLPSQDKKRHQNQSLRYPYRISYCTEMTNSLFEFRLFVALVSGFVDPANCNPCRAFDDDRVMMYEGVEVIPMHGLLNGVLENFSRGISVSLFAHQYCISSFLLSLATLDYLQHNPIDCYDFILLNQHDLSRLDLPVSNRGVSTPSAHRHPVRILICILSKAFLVRLKCSAFEDDDASEQGYSEALSVDVELVDGVLLVQ